LPIATAVVGFGISAKVFHLPFITTMDEFQLTGILQRSGNEASEKYPGIRTFRTIDELVADNETELIVITTPNETHYEYAKKSLLAGKHVVLEKPFTNTLNEAAELIQLANEKKLVLSVYQNRRYVSDFLTIKQLLQQGSLGEIHEFIARYDRYRPAARPNAWREAPLHGSGILYDLGPHLIDQALHLFGMPSFITADIRLQRPHARVDDYFELWLDYGKLKVSLHAGMLIREQGPRYIVHGSKGSFIKYGEDVQEAKLRNGELPTVPEWGLEPASMHGKLFVDDNGAVREEVVPSLRGHYGHYYRNVFESIVHGKPVSETGADGANTILLIELAMQSAKLKQTVEVPFPYRM
jgi:scyllo-inositol 2-dehydrogenase (NADP+)